jgi:metal-responsive CopG/Arc/MetJ family transcriptional regulator
MVEVRVKEAAMDGPKVGPASDDTVSLAVPANMLAQVDAHVGAGFNDRQDFILTAIRYYLDHLRDTQAQSTIQQQ